MNKLASLYLYTVSILGIIIAINYIFMRDYMFYDIALFFILALIIWDCNEYTTSSGGNTISMGFPIVILLLVFFGPSIANIGVISSTFATSIYRKIKEKEEKIFNYKFFFNIGQLVLSNAIVYKTMLLINMDTNNIDIWKLFFIIFIYHIVNATFLTLALSLISGCWVSGYPSLKTLLYYFYTTMLSVFLVFLYKFMGITGAILSFVTFIPFQQTTIRFVQYRDREEELFKDELTQLYNYKYFENVLNNKKQKNENFSLLMIDLDKFKEINDEYGHNAGNLVLKEFSRILRLSAGRNNVICRYRGDEFLILAKNDKKAEKVANNILNNTIKYIVNIDNDKFQINCSIGINNDTIYEQNIKDIMKKVDIAMYQSKKKGSNQITIYSQQKYND